MQQVIERWQGHLDETEIRIGVTELLGFGSGYVNMNSVAPDRKYRWGQVGNYVLDIFG